MAYTDIDDPTINFNTKLYTGNGSTNAITGVGFQPDWTLLKDRNDTSGTRAYDSVRGAIKRIRTDLTDAEIDDSDGLTAFGSDGFTLGADGATNASSTLYVSWNWKAGTSFTNDASATSVGTIDSSGSTNQTAGFSIVSWTGTGSAGTVAHNLGNIPEWYVIKVRTGESNNWAVYHHKSNANPEQYALYLDGDSAATDDSGLANDTAPTSTVFSLTGSNYGNKNTYTYIGYFFNEVKGYSKFGSYEGNGNADGPFIYLGFRPAWCMFRNTTGDKWSIYDAKRSPSNVVDDNIRANQSNAEVDQASKEVDFLSNGIKIRTNSGEWNGNGNNIVFFAFAEAPFTNSSGVPCNAR
tara:strand:- start:360 stop:1415 length:1056 start_codon:yes stop_codon:yes gene_type:complete